MKKTMLSIAAVLTFGIASAQENPAQTRQPQPAPVKMDTDSKNKAGTDISVPIDAKTLEQNKQGINNDLQPRKDELKTQDHVKSTPDHSTVKSKEKDTKRVKAKKKKE